MAEEVITSRRSASIMEYGDRSGAALIAADAQQLAQVPRNTPAELLRTRRRVGDTLGSFQLIGISGRLTAIDPYGDTLMNRQESAAALREIHVLRQRCSDERQLAALDDLATMLEQCAATPSSYLWFAGD
ncbi:hypothetical protein [Streptomyces sp. NPDC002619]|uniref:hypothetical protein n=1 Tax=Streptomyces sp. NPDC002619 TaxID=3364655 RepID=UPI0036915929